MLSKPKILVCSDFSKYSNMALAAAEKIRRITHGSIHALHVCEHTITWDWMTTTGMQNPMNDKVETDIFTSSQKRLNEQLRGLEVQGEAHISIGLPASVILKYILEEKIDMVIIGHKGSSGTSFYVGNIAEKIVSTSPIPLLVIKAPLEDAKIAALVDPKEDMQGTINWAEELSYLLDSKLTVISVLPSKNFKHLIVNEKDITSDFLSYTAKKELEMNQTVEELIRKELVRYIDATIRVETQTEKKLSYDLDSILNYEKINLIVMKRHQAKFLEKILIGSETRRMLELFSGNLFILPP